jgi:hypothetical protein
VSSDPLVTRITRTAALVCALFTVGAWIGWGWRMAAGVLGGGLLIAISLYTIGGGVSAIVSAASGESASPQKLAITLLKVVFRYALLGFLAYVMIARLRLHPLGLLVGATSITAAVFVEAVRLQTKRS